MCDWKVIKLTGFRLNLKRLWHFVAAPNESFMPCKAFNPFIRWSVLMDFHWLKKANFDSATLLKEMRKQTPSALSKIHKTFTFIIENNLQNECILVGGMAVAHWLSRAITPDVDFLCRNINAVKAMLSKKKISFSPITFANLGTTGGLTVSSFNADFLDPEESNSAVNMNIIDSAAPSMIAGMRINVADPAALAIQKFVTGRSKDIDDGFKLLAVCEFSKLKVMLKKLARFLPEEMSSKEIWSYAKL